MLDSEPRGLGETAPAVDIAEKETAYEITAEFPGIDQNNIEVKLANGVLTIKGEKKQETEGQKPSLPLSRAPTRRPLDRLARDDERVTRSIQLEPKSVVGRLGKRSDLGALEDMRRQQLHAALRVARQRRIQDGAMLLSRLRARKRLRLQGQHAVTQRMVVHRPAV